MDLKRLGLHSVAVFLADIQSPITAKAVQGHNALCYCCLLADGGVDFEVSARFRNEMLTMN